MVYNIYITYIIYFLDLLSSLFVIQYTLSKERVISQSQVFRNKVKGSKSMKRPHEPDKSLHVYMQCYDVGMLRSGYDVVRWKCGGCHPILKKLRKS